VLVRLKPFNKSAGVFELFLTQFCSKILIKKNIYLTNFKENVIRIYIKKREGGNYYLKKNPVAKFAIMNIITN